MVKNTVNIQNASTSAVPIVSAQNTDKAITTTNFLPDLKSKALSLSHDKSIYRD